MGWKRGPYLLQVVSKGVWEERHLSYHLDKGKEPGTGSKRSDQEKKQGRELQEEGTASGDTLRTEKAWTVGRAEKQQVWLQCGYRGKHEAGEGRQAPDRQGILRRNWDLIPKGAKQMNHMT